MQRSIYRPHQSDVCRVVTLQWATGGVQEPCRPAKLKQTGIIFAITSGRPPRGMSLIEPLEFGTPIAAFNGGLLARPDMSVIEQRVIPDLYPTTRRRR